MSNYGGLLSVALRDTGREGMNGLILAIAISSTGRKIFGRWLQFCHMQPWQAARCLAVRKALTKAIQLAFCRFAPSISSRGVEELCLGKMAPWLTMPISHDGMNQKTYLQIVT